MTIIEIIKAEVEKRLKNTRDYMNGAGMKYKGPKYHASRGRESAYDAILSFLSTLESKKPIISGDNLESAIDSFWNTASGYQPKFVTLEVKKDGFEKIARYFAEWGAAHNPLPEDTVLFNKGMEEGKRLMMEEAVEGEVVKDWDNNLSVKSGVICGFKFGEKVRVIVLPKED